MNDEAMASPRVLALVGDAERRAAMSATLAGSGYRVAHLDCVSAIDVEMTDAAVVLLDVSLPRAWSDVGDEHARVRAKVAGRCPVVLFGERPRSELERGSPHIPWDDGGRTLLAFLRRLLDTAPASAKADVSEHHRPTRMPSRPDIPEAVTVPRRRLLIVDESEMALDLMQMKLKHVGFDVRTAVSFGELRAIASSFVPEVIIASATRPDRSIRELAADLRSLSSGALLLLSSSLPDDQLAALAADAGADGFVSKRSGVEASVAQIVKHVERLPIGPPSVATTARPMELP